ncbi:MAG: fumarate reductase subunit C [Rhodospirillaceae bacterium]|jgi:fumarate reductase subunit C|nr:fumarate reductase subunit C [Rhodospirillales bacterium]MBT3906324.1 fumarate reductase subunit C [Rhodospirillaceae bacterium]MBT4702248.1 fumarate reductase subunit C [Rhodospirillaceae bacterium]MBT6221560.1 fumarate reductase subunit C [Rhodospirillaceae bacterium]MBT6361141.1 fumarate reductase subunit C [Rhodospirillaceae bacterium]
MTHQPYVRPMPASWWMRQGRYMRYMIREVTCLFIGLHAFVLLIGTYRLSQGREAFEAFLTALWSPAGQLMSTAILVMAVIHSVTWFNLTPKAMPVWIGDKQVPDWVIVAAHYGGWAVVSIVVLILAGRLS